MKRTLLFVFLGLMAGLVLAEGTDEPEDRRDPCATKECGKGYECDLDEENKATCVCIRKCQHDTVPVKVCTSQNATFESECEFYRQQCMCNTRNEECQDSRIRTAQIDYYGECKEITECSEVEMNEFPTRMREWLFLVMEELDRRNDLTGKAHNWVEEAKRMGEHKWVLPVIWKFCNLDVSHSKDVNWEELFPITAPLKPMEHCTVPFLKKCDTNNNGNINLQEWGVCLGLSQDEIQDRCDELRD
jgi:hypothetical protein